MELLFSTYIETLTDAVYKQVDKSLSDTNNFEWAIKRLKYHLHNVKSIAFHKYYFRIISDESLFLSDSNYFKSFKQKYSLQGIDNEYLLFLEGEKPSILTMINERDLLKLYTLYFAKAQIKHSGIVKERELASFFTKLVHTYLPNDYSALDNPIKTYFGLKNEGFFISFIVISEAYKKWIVNNKYVIKSIRNRLSTLDNNNLLIKKTLTDLKILDLIFWVEANHP